MQYLTYDIYKELGGTLDETAFDRNIDRACGVVDNATHQRIEEMADIPSQAKALCRDLVEYFAEEFGSSKQISSRSESAGPVAQSESYVIRSAEERAGEIDDMCKDYLMGINDDYGTPLLYRGCLR